MKSGREEWLLRKWESAKVTSPSGIGAEFERSLNADTPQINPRLCNEVTDETFAFLVFTIMQDKVETSKFDW
jgi:hypothetical protein